MFDFDSGAAGGTVNVFEPIIAGALYHVDVEWTFPDFALIPPPFGPQPTLYNTSFDIVSLTSSLIGTDTVNDAVGAKLGSSNNPWSGDPLGTIVLSLETP